MSNNFDFTLAIKEGLRLGKERLEIKDRINKVLAKYKDSIIAEYKQNIEDTIADNTERLAEIEKICSEDNTDEIKLIEGKIERVKSLLQNNINIQKQLPSIG